MKRFLLIGAMVLLAFTTGCRVGTPVQEFNNIATPGLNATELTEKDVRKAIITGCALHGWQPREISASLIEAKLVVRGKHTVVVDIPYTANSYSIKFKSSTNMEEKINSDGTTVIHPNYNKWVNTLSQDINSQLSKIDL